MVKIITFLSDFGNKDNYVSQMKAVASSYTKARLIDISHNVSKHNIREGAFILRTAVPFFPDGTIHIAVVDPGVGGGRNSIVIITKKQIFIGPDNGILIPAASLFGDFKVIRISNKKCMLDNVSNTFHGRDIFTSTAACILNGMPFHEIGPIIQNFVHLDFGSPDVDKKSATGKILYIDGFGNIVTNIRGEELRNYLIFDKKLMLFIDKKNYEIPFVKSYDFVKKGDLLATIGSSKYLEISMNQGNAAKKLKTKLDDEIKILYN